MPHSGNNNGNSLTKETSRYNTTKRNRRNENTEREMPSTTTRENDEPAIMITEPDFFGTILIHAVFVSQGHDKPW